MEVILSFETSVLAQTTRRYIQEGDYIRNCRYENLKSYKYSEVWSLSCNYETDF
jgi:hypothetical protein